MTIKTLFLGDIVGKAACEAVIERVPVWRREWALDCVVVNGENAASNGLGLTADICNSFYEAGVDCITTGNHIWDQREIIPHIKKDSRLLRPANFVVGTPGNGHVVLRTSSGFNVLVINVILRQFMGELSENPFFVVRDLLQKYKLGRDVQAIIIDAHGEVTSETMAMGHMCDGKASLVVGTHTHIPTADGHIMENGTAYQTDAGMCGDYNSVLGFNKDMAIGRFLNKVPKPRIHVTNETDVTLAGLYVEIDKKTGLASRIEQVIFGGCLKQSLPVIINKAVKTSDVNVA